MSVGAADALDQDVVVHPCVDGVPEVAAGVTQTTPGAVIIEDAVEDMRGGEG
jgi:hypothetical protein